jgi:glycosyltransferase involved in cell wall biosynthesis
VERKARRNGSRKERFATRPDEERGGVAADPAESSQAPLASGRDALELTILMPCLDEARTLGDCIRAAQGFLRDNRVRGEILVADNGSRDGSQEIARALGASVVEIARPGYGSALRGGIAQARGRLVIMGDSDGSYDFRELGPMLQRLRAGADLVVGNRYRGGIEPGAMPFLHRRLGNPLLSWMGRKLFGTRAGDFYCGLRGFSRRAVERLELRSPGMEFALEMLVKAKLTGLEVDEVPVRLAPDGRGRPSHLRTWRDGWRSLHLFLVYSPRWLFFYPGLALIAVGAGVGAWILFGPHTLGGVRFDVHTLLYCAAAISIGVQLVVSFVLGKVLAVNAGLHPPTPRVERVLASVRVEYGLAVGGVLFALGVCLSAGAAVQWARTSFGDLDPFQVMRVTIPGALFITLGLAIVGWSFLFSLLQIESERRHERKVDP